MVLAELGGAIKGALSKLNNATVIDEEGACVCPPARPPAAALVADAKLGAVSGCECCAAPLTDPRCALPLR